MAAKRCPEAFPASQRRAEVLYYIEYCFGGRIVINYEQLLDSATALGQRLLDSGAEIHRVEDSVQRLLRAYGVEGEVFAIPNCLIVSFTGPDGHVYTRMLRARVQGVNIEGIERYNALSRRLCAAPPEDTGALLDAVQRAEPLRTYPMRVQLLGYLIGGLFFTLFFSGGLAEALVGGLAGLGAGLTVLALGRRSRSNFFVNTMAAAAVLALVAYAARLVGLDVNTQVVISGSIMTLVPGLVFTNFMSDLLTGDIVAGLSTFARAVLSAGAIALGTGVGITLLRALLTLPAGSTAVINWHPLLYCLFAALGCLGFCFPYNVWGRGMLLCCLGGALGWGAYLGVQAVGGNEYLRSLMASVVVSIYAEVMARLRKCPATSYLVISFFPLVPGLTIYQAMDYSIQGETQLFLETFIRTFGIAGCIALGSLLVSTAVRIVQKRRGPAL